jgi:hypothetical protein
LRIVINFQEAGAMRSRHYAMLSACLGMSLLAMSARPAMSADITVEQAIAQSKQTGKPILAVFGTET